VLVRDILDDDKTYITTGSTFDNADNLADTYLEDVRRRYEGTRLGEQELYAKILPENEGALWTLAMIDAAQVARNEVPPLIRTVVAVDPAVSSNVESDHTGIVVAGICEQGKAYVLGDYTFKGSPETWANKTIELYHKFSCSRIVYESNQGKDLIPSLFKTIDENLPLKGVHASTAKIARAEPVSALYEQGKVFHVRNPEDTEASLKELERQMTSYEPLGKHKSPDRYDAMVWALTDLMLKGYAKPQIKLVYSNAKGLR
jgi:predicted phage terminase large subunit-like protein